MRNKFYLSIILLTPPTVLLLSWLYFTQTFDPDGSYDGKTRQNGVFFKSYFNFNQFKNSLPTYYKIATDPKYKEFFERPQGFYD